MGAPKRSNNTAEAVEANRRRGDRSAAARLRERGWHVTPPEELTANVRHAIVEDGPESSRVVAINRKTNETRTVFTGALSECQDYIENET